MDIHVPQNVTEDGNHSPQAIALELSLFPRFFESDDSGNGTSTDQSSSRQVPIVEQQSSSPAKKNRTFLFKIHFLICCIGYSVGLGNIWRFPYLAMIHGGGTFLIAYMIMTVFVGTPLVFLELALGQYAGKSPVILFSNLSPIFCGLGLAMLVVTALVLIYYNVLLAWILIYIFSSFAKVLPWAACDPSWCSPGCFSTDQYSSCARENRTFFNGTCYEVADLCESFGYLNSNASHCFGPLNDSFPSVFKLNDLSVHRVPAAVDYYTNYVLDMSPGIDSLGNLKWQLVLALSVAWILVFVCLIRSSYSSGKLIYFTALFPWVLLLILLVKSLSLEGALSGIIFFFTPQFQRLLDAEIWGDAAVQVLFSLGTTFGALISLSSNNTFQNNCLRDAVVVVICDTVTSLIAGVAIFSVLGSMAIDLNVSVDEIVPSGLELTFITIPEAVASFAIPPLWSFLFFSMLLTLGLDTQYTTVASFQTAIEDAFPSLKSYHIHVLGTICLIGFIFGLPMTTEAGIYIFKLFDKYTINWPLLIIGILECVVVMWLYGNCSDSPNGFVKHIEDMLGRKLSGFWITCWKFIIPVGLSLLLLSQWLTTTTLHFGNYTFPNWAYAVGWVISFSSILIIPIGAGYCVVNIQRKKLNSKFLFYPTENWNSSRQSSDSDQKEKSFYSPLDVHKLGCYRKE